jgi:hypothetical protein
MGVEDKTVKSSFANAIFRKEKFVVSASEMRLHQLKLPFCLCHENGYYGFIYQVLIVVV